MGKHPHHDGSKVRHQMASYHSLLLCCYNQNMSSNTFLNLLKLFQAVAAKVEVDKRDRQISDLKTQWEELTQSMQKIEEEISMVRRECQQEKFEMQKENESKV